MKILIGPKRISRKHSRMPESMCSKISSLLVLPPIVWNTIWKSCARGNRKDISYVSQIYGDSSLKPCYMKRYNSSTFLFRFAYLVKIEVRADSKSKNGWDCRDLWRFVLSNSPDQPGSARAGCPQHGLLNVSRGEDTTSLGNICQCLTTLTEKGGFACLFVFQIDA